jgi:GAF domain-containing protein
MADEENNPPAEGTEEEKPADAPAGEEEDPMTAAPKTSALVPTKKTSPTRKGATGKRSPQKSKFGGSQALPGIGRGSTNQLTSPEFMERFDELSELLASIGADLDTARMVQRIKAVTCEIVEAQQAVVFLVDSAKKELRGFDSEGKEVRFSLMRGIAGYVATSGKHMNVTVVSKEEKLDAKVDLFVGSDLNLRVDTLLCVPVYSPTREVCMVVTALNKKTEPYRFVHHDEVLMRSVCRQAAVAHRNCVEFEKTVRSKDQTEMLLKASLELCQEVETKSVVYQAAAHMRNSLECERASLYLMTPGGDELVKWTRDPESTAEKPELLMETIPIKGVAKKVIADASTVNIPDISKHPMFKSTSKPLSLLCMPVLGPNGSVAAVMQALNGPGTPFTKDHEEYLGHMSSVVGTALHNANFHRDVVNVQQNISVISSSLELDEVLQIITQKTAELLQVRSAVVFLVDTDSRNLWFQQVLEGEILRKFANMRLYPAGKVALTGNTICIHDCGKDPNIDNKELKEHIGITARHVLAMPVRSPDGTIVGVIHAANKIDDTSGVGFTAEDEVLLRCIASHAGNALFNGKRYAEACTSRKDAKLFVDYMRALWSKITVADIMDAIVSRSEDLLNCDKCVTYLLDPQTEQLYAKLPADDDSREERRLRNDGRGIVGYSKNSSRLEIDSETDDV